MELQTDEQGIVTFLPLRAWSVSIVQDQTVGLAVDYFATAADAAAGRTTRIQLHIDDEVARQIGRAMELRANMLIERRNKPPAPLTTP
jgi:hypothetical protein